MQAGSSIPSLSHVKSVEKQNFPERRRKRKKEKVLYWNPLPVPSVRQNCNTVATTVHKGIYFCLSCVSILKGGGGKVGHWGQDQETQRGRQKSIPHRSLTASASTKPPPLSPPLLPRPPNQHPFSFFPRDLKACGCHIRHPSAHAKHLPRSYI